MIRLSRPCYDKAHRCPGWAGGGLKYARRVRCTNGYISIDYTNRWWRWRTWTCNTCNVVTLPSVVRWTSPGWIRFAARIRWDRRR